MDNNFENSNYSDETEITETGSASQPVNGESAQQTQSENVNTGTANVPPYIPPQTAVPPVFTAPSTPPQSQNNTSYYDAGSGYMPYGYYQPKPQAEKEKSKNKKIGIVIAAVIVAISVLIVCVLTVMAAVKGVTGNKSPEQSEKETIQAEIPLITPEQNSNSETASGNTAKDIYQKTYESNVGVLVYSKTQSTVASEGSGVILPTVISGGNDSGKTYIVTCAHVLETTSSFKTVVKTYDGEQYDAQIVGVDKKTDIGVLAIDATGLKSADFADSSSLSVGDTVYALGNPGGSTFFGSFTNGMISAIARPVNSPVGYEIPCIQHTAAINPGNSGGALLNENGQVIGINSSKIASTEYEGMGFAVPSETVKQVVEDIINNGYVTNRAILGIRFLPSAYSQVHSIVVQSYDLPKGSLIIQSISENSDLKNKDVKEGDMVIGFNGKDLEDYNDLLNYVDQAKVGDKITLTICRIDQNYKISKFEIEVKLVEDTGDFVTGTQE